jgi:valyl-tRNA synthetase
LESARNFANKIWQAAKFVLMSTPQSDVPVLGVDVVPQEADLELADRWILSRLNRLVKSVDRLFASHQYGEAGRQVNDFVWSEYCDWYIEASKVRLYDGDADNNVVLAALLHVLETSLRLLHPFMPYVTEAIWQALPDKARQGEALIVARWPEPSAELLDAEAEEQMTLMMDLIRGIRNRRAEYHVTPGERIPAKIATADAHDTLKRQRAVLCSLAKLDPARLSIEESMQPPSQAATIVVGRTTCYLPLAEIVDLEEEREWLSKELDDLEHRVGHSEELLDGPFAERAPEHVVQRERDKLKDLKTEWAELERRLETLS